MAEAYTYATQSIDRLLAEHPERAAIILAKCYRKYKEIKHEIDSILQLSGPGASRASLNPAIPIPSPGSVHGHRRSPSSQLAKSPHHPSGTTKSNIAPTPPGSSSARSSKGSSGSGETILLIDAHIEGVEDVPVVLRTDAAVDISLIREDIVNERMLGAKLKEEDRPCRIVLPPNIVLPGVRAEIRLAETTTLTWRRPTSLATHRTVFFLVPRHVLSTDAVLGYKDSGKSNLGSPPAAAAPYLERQGYREVHDRQEVQSPTVVPLSFHLSQVEPVINQTQSRHQYDGHMIESYQVHRAPDGLSSGEQQPVQSLPILTNRNASSTQESRTRSSLAPVQIPSNNSESPNRRLRMSLKWGTTPVNLWLDLDSSAEAFFQTLRDACKRRQIHNWNSWVIWLDTEPRAPEDPPYRLTLGEDLDADWAVTVEWLEQNRREKSPHISGSIEFEEGR